MLAHRWLRARWKIIRISKTAILVAYLVALLVETILCLHAVVVTIIRERAVSLRLSVLGEACVRK